MNCLIVVGEKSGEEHLQSFFPKLKQLAPQVNYFGVGGDWMRSQGIELFYDIKDFAAMGFSFDVIKKIPYYKQAMRRLVEECKRRQCRHAILVDFQGFNMALAKQLKANGIKVYYYVAPQAWGWKEYRAQKLKTITDYLFCILPFEKKWFQQRGIKNVISVGHPVWHHYQDQLQKIDRKAPTKIERILFLPGSRDSEVSKLLPLYHQVIAHIKRHDSTIQCSMVRTQSVRKQQIYDFYASDYDTIYTSSDLAQALLHNQICVAASGTVTLTCGLFQIPTIVCYKVSLFNQFFIYNFIRSNVGLVSLTNIIFNRMIFPEMLQDDAHPTMVWRKLHQWINHPDQLTSIIDSIRPLKQLLGGEGIDVAKLLADDLSGKDVLVS
jgi:lipid-A-disaccharide synthase